MLVPPKPLVTPVQEPIVDWIAAGKCTVTPEQSLSILLKWEVLEPKLLGVNAGKLTLVSEVHPLNA